MISYQRLSGRLFVAAAALCPQLSYTATFSSRIRHSLPSSPQRLCQLLSSHLERVKISSLLIFSRAFLLFKTPVTPPPPPDSNRFVATGGASCHGCVMPDWLASYLFMYKPLLNSTLPLIIPFAEEMKLIGVAVNPAVRRCTVHHFKLDFFFFFTCCYVSE